MTGTWAGYDHLPLAKAITAPYVRAREQEGGRGDPRLLPLLACLAELLPWLKQWHNEYDADYAAAFLKSSDEDVLRMVKEQGLSARQVGDGWRFLKAALCDWLRVGRTGNEGGGTDNCTVVAASCYQPAATRSYCCWK